MSDPIVAELVAAEAGAAAVVGGTNGVAGAFAAAFYGPVVVSGDFTVVGGAKSAAVWKRPKARSEPAPRPPSCAV